MARITGTCSVSKGSIWVRWRQHVLVYSTNTWLLDVDSDNLIRQRSGNNRTVGWTEGSISKSKLTAWDGDLVGLTACASAINETIPIRLFYASSSTAFEEYLWRAEEDEWIWQQTWEGYSGAADVGCFSGTGDYRYLGLVTPKNQLEFWYQPAEDIEADWQKGTRPLSPPKSTNQQN